MELLEGKVRPIGNSLCVILPAKAVKEDEIESGDTIRFSILKPKRHNLSEIIGKFPKLKGFDRDLTGRD